MKTLLLFYDPAGVGSNNIDDERNCDGVCKYIYLALYFFVLSRGQNREKVLARRLCFI